ncbi:MAG: FtsB family cell division protein [Candidatus Anammoxibacter sp.]
MINRNIYERHLLSKFLIFMGITIAIVVFFTNSISKKQEERGFMLKKERTLSNDVQKREKENSKLYRQHNSMLTDPLEIERYAREHLNYVAPGEESFDTLNFKIISNDNEKKNEELQVPKNHLFEGRFPWQFPAIIILVSTIVFYLSYCFENHKISKFDRE